MTAPEPLCRAPHPSQPWLSDPHTRIVRCNLPKDHGGDHDEMVDGEAGIVTWPQVRNLDSGGSNPSFDPLAAAIEAATAARMNHRLTALRGCDEEHGPMLSERWSCSCGTSGDGSVAGADRHLDEAAVRAAAPILAAQAVAERDQSAAEWRADMQDYRVVKDRLAAAERERDELRRHILDIDAHATPYGDIPDEPGWVGTYLLTAGALHRALGKVGHSAPSCSAEALWDELRAELAIPDDWEPYIEPPVRRVAAFVRNAMSDAQGQRDKQRSLVRQLATAERDALLRAANEMQERLIELRNAWSEDARGFSDGVAWLRERAKAVSTDG